MKVLQRADKALRRDAAVHWAWTAQAAAIGVFEWRHVADVVAAAVLTLRNQAWDVDNIEEVKSPNGEVYDVMAASRKPGAARALLAEVMKVAEKLAWKKAAEHASGVGA